MKPDGLVTVLGEACINGKTVESTSHFHRNSLQMSDCFACGLEKKNLWLKTHFLLYILLQSLPIFHSQ